MTFPARLTAFLDAIKNEKDPIKRFAYVQQMDALLVNHAEALRDLVAAAENAKRILKDGGVFPIKGETWQQLREAFAKLEEQ